MLHWAVVLDMYRHADLHMQSMNLARRSTPTDFAILAACNTLHAQWSRDRDPQKQVGGASAVHDQR